MTVPHDCQITYAINNNGSNLTAVTDVRGICPYCRVATTFQVRSYQADAVAQDMAVYLILLCNYAPCRKTVYVETIVLREPGIARSRPQNPFFLHPPGAIESPHASVP